MTVRIDHATTSGTFSLDGRTLEVDNNVWVIGDNTECVVIDAAHDANAILGVVGSRTVTAILLTHGHDDHLSAVGSLWDETGATIHLHPGDRTLWDRVYPDVGPDADLIDGQEIVVAGIRVRTIHTPGHSRGSVCFYAPELTAVFSGDTLLHDGPGATGGSFSDFGAIIGSIERRLLTLPPETAVHAGHGETTTIGAAASNLRAAASGYRPIQPAR
ncbi:MBL fold metallo-hydrolase [Phytoactinopolyspora mesophila]|uniref:MBL fold metallo-hydrolase n=1 Tax=Phytoactinopolyspora mesophila TaxID=2650750 RepID=A0A7K3M8K1_9ACTN|nr:MBL fold metallo-hydrolase [Phytoactinopolyspora mesophila]NDL59635.1 MBL fold metallo-hydrolase [Phytoactinopolyspora mesophila]